MKRLYATIPAADFGPQKLKAVRQTMIDAGWTRRYINNQVGRIARMFRWATEEELIGADVYHALQAVKGLAKGRSAAAERDPIEPVAEHVFQATLPHMPAVVADLARFQRLTGCRPSEACQLRPADIDRTGDVWIFTLPSHKTEHHGRARFVPIGPQAQAVLRPYLLRDADSYCFSPQDTERKVRQRRAAERKTALSCGNCPGTNRKRHPQRRPSRCYSTASYRRAITRACDDAKVERWAPNRLRHARATEIRERYGLEGAQVLLGHSNAAVTQIYAQRDLQLAIRIAKETG